MKRNTTKGLCEKKFQFFDTKPRFLKKPQKLKIDLNSMNASKMADFVK